MLQAVEFGEQAERLSNKLYGIELDQNINRNSLKVINITNRASIENNSSNQKEDEELKNIRKRKDGRWEWRKTINKQRYNITKRTQAQLLVVVREFKQRFQSNIVVKADYTVMSWLNYWFETYKKGKISASTQKTILSTIKFIGAHKVAKEKLKNLTSEHIQHFLNSITISRKKEFVTLYLKAALTKAHGLGKIRLNPFEEVVVDKKLNNIESPYTYTEQVAILKAIKGTDIEHAIMFYLLTGIRANEMPKDEQILKKSMSFETNTIKLIAEKKRSVQTVYKYVDLSDCAMQYIFKNAKKITQYIPKTIYKKFKIILKSIKIAGHIHKLRHTFTTNHFYLGNPDKLISSWLAHSSVELTRRVYIFIDRTITKQKIIDLYGDLYYIFDK